MARQKKESAEPSIRPKLRRSRAEAITAINERLTIGEELIASARHAGTKAALDRTSADYYKWNDFNTDLLRHLFSVAELADKYSHFFGLIGGGNPTLQDRIDELVGRIQDKVDRLNSIKERVSLFEVEGDTEARTTQSSSPSSNKVFVVHGHDDSIKAEVARLLTAVGLEPIILHEQANQGRTIIEKFEDHSDVVMAIVLLTADDVGAARQMDSSTSVKLQPRARQNVIFELGFFNGKLGRAHVIALYKDNVEILSDYAGVIYILIDSAGAWKFQVGKELRAAGLPVDLNNVV